MPRAWYNRDESKRRESRHVFTRKQFYRLKSFRTLWARINLAELLSRPKMYIHPARVEMIVTTKIPLATDQPLSPPTPPRSIKFFPPPLLYPWNGVSTTICESVNADFSFQYCRRRAIMQPLLPSVQKPSFVRCCELSRIVGRLRGRRSNELSQFSRRTWYCYNRKWLNCIFFFLSFFLVGVI